MTVSSGRWVAIPGVGRERGFRFAVDTLDARG